jgi:predicted short-subunit dehydrogenase-like oxidoreductase (DUF2520 family)
MRVGFIGAGKAGCSFGKLIAERGAECELSGYFSRSRKSADYAAEITRSRAYENARKLLADSDIIFLTVPDGAIAEVWNGLREYPETGGKLFCHMSGSLTSEIFAAHKSALFGSLHPALAIAGRENSWRNLADAYYTFEGNDEAYARIIPLAHALGLRAERIGADKKILYHAACVFASNLVCALAYDAEKLLRNCGLSEEFSAGAWKTLFIGNAENIVKSDPVTALTGPVERGDTETVEKHLDALASRRELRDTYTALTETLAEIAAIKHGIKEDGRVE